MKAEINEEFTVQSKVKFYRQENSNAKIVADTKDSVRSLGIQDMTVSRHTNDQGEASYVELYPQDRSWYIRDQGSSNPTRVADAFGEFELENEESYPIEQENSVIKLGYRAEVPVKVSTPSVQRTADWDLILKDARHLADFLEIASVERLHQQAITLRDNLQRVNRKDEAPQEIAECLDTLNNEFINQLHARKRSKSSDADPHSETIDLGRRLTTRVIGIIENTSAK